MTAQAMMAQVDLDSLIEEVNGKGLEVMALCQEVERRRKALADAIERNKPISRKIFGGYKLAEGVDTEKVITEVYRLRELLRQKVEELSQIDLSGYEAKLNEGKASLKVCEANTSSASAMTLCCETVIASCRLHCNAMDAQIDSAMNVMNVGYTTWKDLVEKIAKKHFTPVCYLFDGNIEVE